MRQSSRAFAAAPVWQSDPMAEEGGWLGDGLVVEVLERPGEVAAAGEHRDQKVDRERDEAETTAADGEAATRQRDATLAAPILDLRRVEAGVLPEAHRWVLPRRGARQT